MTIPETAKTKSPAQLLEENHLLEEEVFRRAPFHERLMIYLIILAVLVTFLIPLYSVVNLLKSR